MKNEDVPAEWMAVAEWWERATTIRRRMREGTRRVCRECGTWSDTAETACAVSGELVNLGTGE